MYAKKLMSAALSVFLFLWMADSLSAQNGITLKLNGATLREAFSEVESRSSYSFFYDAQSLDLSSRVSVNLTDASIDETVRAILSGTGISWSIKGKQIALIPPPRPCSDKARGQRNGR